MKKTSKLCGLVWLVCQLVDLPAHAQKSPDSEFALTRSGTNMQAALFFRSVHAQEASIPVLFSLNPADEKFAPAVLDSTTGRLRLVQTPAAPVDGVLVLRILELGTFSGRFAAAKAQVREGTKEYDAWGYVNEGGEWVIAPRYFKADTPVNRWGKAKLLDGSQTRDIKIFDLEQRKLVKLPDDHFPWYDRLIPIADHAGLWMEGPETKEGGRQRSAFVLNAATGMVMPLPSFNGVPVKKGQGRLIPAGNERVFDVDTGRIVAAPPAADQVPQVLPGLLLLQDQVNNRTDFQIIDAAAKAAVVKNLRYASGLTKTLFIACDQGDNLAPAVSFGLPQYPVPLDADSKLRCGLMDAKAKWRTRTSFQHFYVFDGDQLVLRGAREWCTLDARVNSAPICGDKVPALMLNAGLWVDARLDTESGQENPMTLYGYRDADSKLVIPFLFDRATPFAGQVASVSQWGVPGLIDIKGRWLTPPPPGNVVQWAQEGNVRWPGSPCRECFGVIDRKGNWVFPPVFSGAGMGSGGRFLLKGNGDSPWLEADGNGRPYRTVYGRNDLFDKRAEDSQSSNADFSLGTLPNAIVATSINGLWGLTDADGKWVVSARFSDVGVISNTRAMAQTKEGWGMINAKGAWLIKPIYDRMGLFSGDSISACLDGVCKTFNIDGGLLETPEELSAILAFGSQEVAPAKSKSSGLWGYIDRKGRWVIEPLYKQAYPFSGKQAIVQVQRRTDFKGDAGERKNADGPPVSIGVGLWSGAKMAAIILLPHEFVEQAKDESWGYSSFQATMGNETLTGLMDTAGQWLVPLRSQWPVASSAARREK